MTQEKKRGRLGQVASVIASVAALVVALTTAWTSVAPTVVEDQEKKVQAQGEKVDQFYALFRTVVEEQRATIRLLLDELRAARRGETPVEVSAGVGMVTTGGGRRVRAAPRVRSGSPPRVTSTPSSPPPDPEIEEVGESETAQEGRSPDWTPLPPSLEQYVQERRPPGVLAPVPGPSPDAGAVETEVEAPPRVEEE